MCSSKFARSWKDHFTCDCPRKVLVCQTFIKYHCIFKKTFLYNLSSIYCTNEQLVVFNTRLQQIKAWFMKCRCVTTICPNPPETGRNNYILAQAAPWVLAAKPFRNICRVEGMAVSGTVTSYNPHKAIKLRGLGRNTDCNKWNLMDPFCVFEFYLFIYYWNSEAFKSAALPHLDISW